MLWLLPVGENPKQLHAADAFGKLHALLHRHAEKRGGQGVGQGAVPGDHREGAEIGRRVQGVLVDDVVVAHAVHREIALIDAGGHAGRVPDADAAGKILAGLVRVPDGGDPAAAVRPVADAADVAADVQHIALGALPLQVLRRPLGGVALAQGAHVDGGLRVRDAYGAGLFIDLQEADVGVRPGTAQLLLRGDRSVLRVLPRRLPACVPEAQHRAQHHVHLSAGDVVHLLGAEQEVHELPVHGQRLSPRIFVEGAEIGHAAVLVIDVKELVVFQQDMRNFGRTVIKPLCRISCIVIYIGDGIEVGVIDLSFRFHALRARQFPPQPPPRFPHRRRRERAGSAAAERQEAV